MKKIIDSSILFAVFTLVAIATAKAETVVWYTFDDLTPGDTLADGTNIVNKANPGTHDATVYGMASNNDKPSSIYMPMVTNGVPEAYRLFDPCTWSYAQNQDLGIRFTAPFTGSATGDGARLEIANHADLRPDEFTVELMVRLPEDLDGATALPGWELIAGQPAFMPCANADAWRIFLLHVENQRKAIPAVRFAKQDSFESNVNATNLVSYSNQNLNLADGKWHHLALVVRPNAADSTKTDVSFYVDYKGATDNNGSATQTLPNRIRFSDAANCPLWIGGTKQTYQLYRGALGEFRFSNEALSPRQFLRPGAVASGFDKDCVLYYDFEEASEEWDWFGATTGDIVNKAMPGIMDGTIVTNTANSNLAPGFVEDTPGSLIRQSLHDSAYQNNSQKSLCNYVENPGLAWDAVNRCGYVKCQPLDTTWFSKTNFTVETFFMTTNNVQKYNSFFQRKGGWNVQFQMGVSYSGGLVGYNITTNETIGQVEQPAHTFTTGEWHHYAVVVDQTGESKHLTAYLDNVLVKQIDLLTGITQNNASNVSDHNGAWFIAGGPSDCAFDGKLDSMRVTLRALEPDEFLSARNPPEKFPAGRTLAHVKFNDETLNADPEGGTMVAGVNAKARNEGSLATFSDDVPGAVIRDGAGGDILYKHNTKSLLLSGSKVTWGSSNGGYQDTYYIRNTLLHEKRTSWTVEFWMKTTATPNTWSRIITASNAGSLGGGYAYALTFWEAKHLSLRGDGNDPELNSTVNVCDGKWHHIAFTYAPNEDYPESKSDVKLYIDYGAGEGGYTYSATTHLTTEPYGNGYGKGLITYPDSLMLVMGMGSNSANTYDGLIDELRISDCALEPSQFLRAERAPGFSIIIR